MRGQFRIKQAASTADELHVGLKNAAGSMEFERVVTKDYGDTLYADIASEHDAVTVVDTASIDLTLTGQQVSAAAIFGSTATTVAVGNHTHANPGITVQEGDVTVDASVTTLDFDASDFNLTESPEDEVNISLNYGTGAGQPAEGNHSHGSAAHIHATARTLGVQFESESTSTFHSTDNQSRAYYMGLADEAYTEFQVSWYLGASGSAITWYEMAIGTSTAPLAFNTDIDITSRGHVSLAAVVVGSTGPQLTTITTSGITAGMELWLLIGGQATTRPGFRVGNLHLLDNGTIQLGTSLRPSTMGSPASYVRATGGGYAGPHCMWSAST